jgi:hypothetical protein
MYRTHESDGNTYLFYDQQPLASIGRSGLRLHPAWRSTVNDARAAAMFIGVTITRLRLLIMEGGVNVVDHLGEGI